MGQTFYCSNRNTEIPFAFRLSAEARRLEYRWSTRGDTPEAGPGESLVQEGRFQGEVRGQAIVAPEGRIVAVISVTQTPPALTPQGIRVEPSLPDRWLWVRAAGPGGPGGWAKAGPFRAQTCP